MTNVEDNAAFAGSANLRQHAARFPIHDAMRTATVAVSHHIARTQQLELVCQRPVFRTAQAEEDRQPGLFRRLDAASRDEARIGVPA